VAIDNNVTVVGNVTRDPELRFTASGQANASFGLAWNRRWQNRQTGEQEEAVSFFNVVAWGTLAENVTESLGKGSRVIVVGRLEHRTYETQDGEKRSVTEIIADEVAPSLRWATVNVIRNERRSGDGGGGAPARTSRSGSGGAGYQEDEEPF
jgi:single-strand DNA-binding protein